MAICSECDGAGTNAAMRELYSTFRLWQTCLTTDEVAALVERGRLGDLVRVLNHHPTPDEATEWLARSPFGHDAMSASICVAARAKRLGCYGPCPTCGESGEVDDEAPTLTAAMVDTFTATRTALMRRVACILERPVPWGQWCTTGRVDFKDSRVDIYLGDVTNPSVLSISYAELLSVTPEELRRATPVDYAQLPLWENRQ